MNTPAIAPKTILVHLADKRCASALLAPATALAAEYGAHLVGLCVLPSVVITAGWDGGPEVVIEEHRTAYRQDMAKLREAFEEATRGRTFAAEWREDDPGYQPATNIVLDHGRTADLIVTSQRDPDWGYSEQLEDPERLVMASGRPVLLVPRTSPVKVSVNLPKRVVVAWNGRREAARAVFDALPLLVQADDVIVVWVNPQSDPWTAGDQPGADICQALARHGVRCEATQNMQPTIDVGHTLLETVKANGADLLVMGCYGHSRIREFVLGGATRHVLKHMTVPVLMSH